MRSLPRFGIIVALLLTCSAPVTTTSSQTTVPSPSAPDVSTSTPVTPSPERTKPPGLVVQPQLPLPTHVRWAIDKGSPDDPQRRSLLVLFYDGSAQGWRIVDQSGRLVFRVPIAGSGIFGPETCVSKARKPNEIATWMALDQQTMDLFRSAFGTYRAIAEGIPSGEARLEIVDSACRPDNTPSSYFDPPPATGYDWTRNGAKVSRNELTTVAGPGHCDWQLATFLSVGWPLGTVATNATQSRQYIRDGRGVIRGRDGTPLKDRLQLRAALPQDAKATGYRYGPLEIYTSPSDQDEAIYVVGGGVVERWPRSDPMTLCV